MRDRSSMGSMWGEQPSILERIITQAKPTEAFRPLPDLPHGLPSSWKLRCFRGRGGSCHRIRSVCLTEIRPYSGRIVSVASRRPG